MVDLCRGARAEVSPLRKFCLIEEEMTLCVGFGWLKLGLLAVESLKGALASSSKVLLIIGPSL